MDGMKLLAEVVIVAGLVLVWPGPDLLSPGGDGRPVLPLPSLGPEPGPPPSGAADWFRRVKPSCNTVEVETALSRNPAPAGWEGRAHEAACFALAGRTDRAREILEGLPGEERWRAAGVVFEAGHPAADAGDDVAAGPLMELVVEFWPNHYMALYHAGAARYARGDHAEARDYLERFLAAYDPDDGWRRNATVMLQRMGG